MNIAKKLNSLFELIIESAIVATLIISDVFSSSCSPTLINRKLFSKTSDIIWVRCTFSHESSAEVQFVLFYWLYKTCICGRSYSTTTDNLLAWLHNKTKQHLQTSTSWALMNIKRCLKLRRNWNLQLFFLLWKSWLSSTYMKLIME